MANQEKLMKMLCWRIKNILRVCYHTKVITVARIQTKSIYSLLTDEMYCFYVTHGNDNKLQLEKEHMYQKVFYEQFNFSFGLPSKDTCENVKVFKNHLLLEMLMKNHRRKKIAALAKS